MVGVIFQNMCVYVYVCRSSVAANAFWPWMHNICKALAYQGLWLCNVFRVCVAQVAPRFWITLHRLPMIPMQLISHLCCNIRCFLSSKPVHAPVHIGFKGTQTPQLQEDWNAFQVSPLLDPLAEVGNSSFRAKIFERKGV